MKPQTLAFISACVLLAFVTANDQNEEDICRVGVCTKFDLCKGKGKKTCSPGKVCCRDEMDEKPPRRLGKKINRQMKKQGDNKKTSAIKSRKRKNQKKKALEKKICTKMQRTCVDDTEMCVTGSDIVNGCKNPDLTCCLLKRGPCNSKPNEDCEDLFGFCQASSCFTKKQVALPAKCNANDCVCCGCKPKKKCSKKDKQCVYDEALCLPGTIVNNGCKDKSCVCCTPGDPDTSTTLAKCPHVDVPVGCSLQIRNGAFCPEVVCPETTKKPDDSAVSPAELAMIEPFPEYEVCSDITIAVKPGCRNTSTWYCCVHFECNTPVGCEEDGEVKYGPRSSWCSLEDNGKMCRCTSNLESVCKACPEPPSPDCKGLKSGDDCCKRWYCSSKYLITAPKQWVLGETGKVCIFMPDEGATAGDQLLVTLGDQTEINFEPGEAFKCVSIQVPDIEPETPELHISGSIGGAQIDRKMKIGVISIYKIFIQTDKFLYQPGQQVQFRMLALKGSDAMVDTSNFTAIWITNPRGDRIAQWTAVSTEHGIIQLSFPLPAVAYEGTYNIYGQTSQGIEQQEFRVEEYELPRFEVTLEPTSYILITDAEASFTVCAKYTFGESVEGTASLYAKVRSYFSYENEDIQTLDKEDWAHETADINGCAEMIISLKEAGVDPNNRWRNSLTVHLQVEEKGTNEMQNMTQSIVIHTSKFQFFREDDNDQNFISPGLPHVLKVKVLRPNGDAAPSEEMQVCKNTDKEECKTYVTDDFGILTVTVIVYGTEDEYLSLCVKPVEGDDGLKHYCYDISLSVVYSPTNSYLAIHNPGSTLQCSSTGMFEEEITVFFIASSSEFSPRITTQVVSKSRIEFHSSQEYEYTSIPSDSPFTDEETIVFGKPPVTSAVRGSFRVSINVPSVLTSQIKVLVFYVRDDSEVVSAASVFKVSQCLANPTSLVWSATTARPGEEIGLAINAAPSSWCALGVVDKSTSLLSKEQQRFSMAGIFSLVSKAETYYCQYPAARQMDHCFSENHWHEYDYHYYYYEDHYMYLEGIGDDEDNVNIEIENDSEDRNVRTRRSLKRSFSPCHSSSLVDALNMFEMVNLHVITDLRIQTLPCPDSNVTIEPTKEYTHCEKGGSFPITYATEVMPESQPDGDAEDGDTAPSPAKRKEDIRKLFPETWLWKMDKLPSSAGTLENKVVLPDTITEWVAEAFCVHPEAGIGLSKKSSVVAFKAFFMDVKLPPTVRKGEKTPVRISVFNYLNQSIYVELSLTSSNDYDIEEDPAYIRDAEGVSTRFCVPSNTKMVNTFWIRPHKYGEVSLRTRAETVASDTDTCLVADSVNEGDEVVKVLKVNFEGVMQENATTDYVCDTSFEGAWDLIFPYEAIPGTERLWMTVSADLMGPTLENLGHLITRPSGCGEQNMINFAPNIFLMRYLEATKQLTTDTENKLLDFMKTGYQGELLYKRKDNSYSVFGDGDPSGSTLLTAFVVKSYIHASHYIEVDLEDTEKSISWLKERQLESGCFELVGFVHNKDLLGGIAADHSSSKITAYVLVALLEIATVQDAAVDVDEKVSNGLECLAADTSDDPFLLCLKSYVYALAETQGYEVSASDVVEDAYAGINDLDGTLFVEGAGYLILAMVNLKSVDFSEEQIHLVRLLSWKRNSQGGFVSTQDTVIALQALSYVNNGENVNLEVTFSYSNETHSFSINEENRLLFQSTDLIIPPPSEVMIRKTGTGCALMQVIQQYNIEEKLVNDFEIRISENCDGHLAFCTAYRMEGSSNMAIMDIQLVSGVIADKQSVTENIQYPVNQYEIDGSQVIFYFDNLNHTETCVSFRVIHEYSVEDTKNGTVEVYDYYAEKDYIISSETFALLNGDECSA